MAANGNSTIALPNSTIVDPLEAPFRQKGGSQKLNLKLLRNRNMRTFYTSSAGTH